MQSGAGELPKTVDELRVSVGGCAQGIGQLFAALVLIMVRCPSLKEGLSTYMLIGIGFLQSFVIVVIFFSVLGCAIAKVGCLTACKNPKNKISVCLAIGASLTLIHKNYCSAPQRRQC